MVEYHREKGDLVHTVGGVSDVKRKHFKSQISNGISESDIGFNPPGKAEGSGYASCLHADKISDLPSM